jgi:GntR family transcriptional repressor for pyruvate dehydrogenase complex
MTIPKRDRQTGVAPDDVLLGKIQSFIAEGRLQPGSKLPSERRLAEQHGISRGYVRKALKKLEFYGIVRTLPQSGSVIAGIGGKALAGLIASIRPIDGREDIGSVMETRAVLETHAARMAARRGTREQIGEIGQCHRDFVRQASRGKRALEEDHLFHLAIARASRNNVAVSLISLITPDIIALNRDFHETDPQRFARTIEEHERVVKAIVARAPGAAAAAMAHHMAMSRTRRLPRAERGRRDGR